MLAVMARCSSRCPGYCASREPLCSTVTATGARTLAILNLVQFLEPVLVSPIGASGGFDANGSPLTYRRAVDAISSKKVDAKSMITHAYPGLESVQKALSEDCRDPGYVERYRSDAEGVNQAQIPSRFPLGT